MVPIRRALIQKPLVAIFCAGLSLFCPLLGRAESTCSAIFSSEYALQGRIEIQGSVVGKLSASSVVKRISEVDKLLGSLASPSESKITIGPDMERSSFDAVSREIYIGLRPLSRGAKNPEINLNTLAHEYGHAIFEKNLLKNSENYKYLKEQYILAQNKITEAAAELQTWNFRYEVTFNKDEKALLTKKAKEKVGEMLLWVARKNTLERYWNVRTSLHELFADAVALVVTQDPKAISAVVWDSKKNYKKYSHDKLLLRDMTEGRSHESMQTWNESVSLVSALPVGELKPNEKQKFNLKQAGDPYYAFLPARWELWDVSKSRLGGELYRQQMLRKIFAILEKNLAEVLKQPADSLGPKGFQNIEKLNQQLIEDFRREL